MIRMATTKMPEGVVRRLIELSSHPCISHKYGIKVLTEALTPKFGSPQRTMLYVADVIEHLSTKSHRWFNTCRYREVILELSGIYLTLLELSGSIALDRETKLSD